MKKTYTKQNAGTRLWETQKAQGTGLCVGADPHFEWDGELNEEFYARFSDPGVKKLFEDILKICNKREILLGARPISAERAAILCSGVVGYFIRVINAAWKCGIRIYKPQAAFYERFNPLGTIIESMICRTIDSLAIRDQAMHFKILDAKRGDLDLTQEPYYAAYLTSPEEDTCPGIPGQCGFDVMTTHTWMGENSIMPGLEYFRKGNGIIVVTRTSNPSGTTFQDAYVTPNMNVELSGKQEPYRYTQALHDEISEILGRGPMAHEVMLFLTEKFSRENDLNVNDVSPIFSVMGSTVKMLPSFRILRPYGVPLIPGFGGQKGPMKNVIPLYIQDGPYRGHIGVESSSRNHNYPCQKKFGGSGDVDNLDFEMERVIEQFEKEEREAYAEAGLWYPF